jgi:hypothetical protein
MAPLELGFGDFVGESLYVNPNEFVKFKLTEVRNVNYNTIMY